LRRRAWAGARLLGAALILAVLLQRLGAGPFLDGLRGLGPGTLLAATVLGAGTTIVSAWRWRLVARALGMELTLPAATAAYYRSQFLNCALPGGVLGDVHRGVRHGVAGGDLGRGLRAVVWDRIAGQVVQAASALVLLLVLPSPVHAAMPAVAVVSCLTVVVLLLAGRRLVRRGPDRLARTLGSAAGEVRAALLQPTVWPAVLLASLLVVGTHVGMLLLAAGAAGVHESPQLLVPLALIVLLAAAIPLNVGGWGPREGVAAWIFAAAERGAGAGAAVATAFGVMVLVATLPGAVVLLTGSLRPRRSATRSEDGARPGAAGVVRSGAREDGAARG
jgi:glycosyltransferase 2 family protein